MNTKHLVSIDLAKKIYQLGIKYPSDYYWNSSFSHPPGYQCQDCEKYGDEPHPMFYVDDEKGYAPSYPAYHCAELLEVMPHEMIIHDEPHFLQLEKHEDYYRATYDASDGFVALTDDHSPANALAKLMIHLQQRGVYDFSKND